MQKKCLSLNRRQSIWGGRAERGQGYKTKTRETRSGVLEHGRVIKVNNTLVWTEKQLENRLWNLLAQGKDV